MPIAPRSNVTPIPQRPSGESGKYWGQPWMDDIPSEVEQQPWPDQPGGAPPPTIPQPFGPGDLPRQGPVTNVGANDQGPAAKIPLGRVQGQPFLLPQYGNLGQTRPLGPREYIRLPDGGWASEMTYTVRLGNQWAVVPGLWIINGVPTRVDEDQAPELAQQSGLNWRTFPDKKSADDYAVQREQIWQTTPFGRSDMQPPLWSRRWPPQR